MRLTKTVRLGLRLLVLHGMENIVDLCGEHITKKELDAAEKAAKWIWHVSIKKDDKV